VYGIELDAVELSGRLSVVLLSGRLVIVAFIAIADGVQPFRWMAAMRLCSCGHFVSEVQLRSCSLLCTENGTVLHK
jgi:hypothetical protein